MNRGKNKTQQQLKLRSATVVFLPHCEFAMAVHLYLPSAGFGSLQANGARPKVHSSHLLKVNQSITRAFFTDRFTLALKWVRLDPTRPHKGYRFGIGA